MKVFLRSLSAVALIGIAVSAMPGPPVPPIVDEVCVGPGENETFLGVTADNTTTEGGSAKKICIQAAQGGANVYVSSEVTGDVTDISSGDAVFIGNSSTVNVTGSGGTVTFNATSSAGLVTADGGDITVYIPRQTTPIIVPDGQDYNYPP